MANNCGTHGTAHSYFLLSASDTTYPVSKELLKVLTFCCLPLPKQVLWTLSEVQQLVTEAIMYFFVLESFVHIVMQVHSFVKKYWANNLSHT
jgi:hypothetical protein